jgi:triosephosphate isomerase
MLKDSGCAWVILGHSERRQYFGETDASVAEKTAAALGAKLRPIVCVGETLKEREGGETLRVVKRQCAAFLDILGQDAVSAAIAYEPVWAIGTGKNAGPAEAEEVHEAIRAWLRGKSAELAERTRVLYGGSVKPDNAAALLACPNVDGALVGGASLDAGQFGAIARAAEALASGKV